MKLHRLQVDAFNLPHLWFNPTLWKDEKYSAVVRALDGALPIPEEGPAVHPSTSITIIPESQPVTVKDEPTEDEPPINQATEEPVSIPKPRQVD